MTLPPASTDLLLLNILTQKGPGQHFPKQNTVCIIYSSISVPTSRIQASGQGLLTPTPNFQGYKPGTWRQEPQAPKTVNSLSHVEVAHKTSRKTVQKPELVVGWEGG